MALVVDTGELDPQTLAALYSATVRRQIYNGLDCMVTHEVHGKIAPQLSPEHTEGVYAFERALQGPALRMMLRGVRIDQDERSLQLYELKSTWQRVRRWLTRLSVEVTEGDVNYRSHIQLKSLFYDTLKLPVQYKREKGQKKVTVGREALEKLKFHFYAIPLINAILKLRDLDKLIQVLESGVDRDGRLRASFNVAATVTGRWSSSKNVFGRGTNLQNITERMRRMFIADRGRKLAYPDLEQAESRVVAHLSQDPRYIEACESGDLHTTVARLIWPDLAWTGDLDKDKKIAESPYYRHFTYRDLSKRGGHLSNYGGSAWKLARALKVEEKLAEEFQETYFSTFRGIRDWHHSVQYRLQSTGIITTPLGRRRTFFGRLNDDHTLREAIAHEPQSTVADIFNIGLLRTWQKYDLSDERIQ